MRLALLRSRPLLHPFAPVRMSSSLSWHQPPPLADVAVVAPGVVRVLGQNPSKYTLEGTNTYLIYPPQHPSPSPVALVDTGEGEEAYTALLERVLRGLDTADGVHIPPAFLTDVILTHWHNDHVNGLAAVLLLNRKLNPSKPAPRIHKLRNSHTDRGLVLRELAPLHDLRTYVTAPGGAEATEATVEGTIHALFHQQRVELAPTFSGQGGGDIRVLHTPGHTVDHTCLVLERAKEGESYFFAGDHVLGAGTTVFEDLRAYMASLALCAKELAELGSPPLFPGHGPVVHDSLGKVKEYIAHRAQRELEIVDLLRRAPAPSRTLTLADIVKALYASYPPSLWGAAGRGVFLHLLKLVHPDNKTHAAHGGQVEAKDDVGHLVPILAALAEPPPEETKDEVPSAAAREALARSRAAQRDAVSAQLVQTRWAWVPAPAP